MESVSNVPPYGRATIFEIDEVNLLKLNWRATSLLDGSLNMRGVLRVVWDLGV